MHVAKFAIAILFSLKCTEIISRHGTLCNVHEKKGNERNKQRNRNRCVLNMETWKHNIWLVTKGGNM